MAKNISLVVAALLIITVGGIGAYSQLNKPAAQKRIDQGEVGAEKVTSKGTTFSVRERTRQLQNQIDLSSVSNATTASDRPEQRIYRNEKYGFSLSIPPNYDITFDQNPSGQPVGMLRFIRDDKHKTEGGRLLVYRNKENLTVDQLDSRVEFGFLTTAGDALKADGIFRVQRVMGDYTIEHISFNDEGSYRFVLHKFFGGSVEVDQLSTFIDIIEDFKRLE